MKKTLRIVGIVLDIISTLFLLLALKTKKIEFSIAALIASAFHLGLTLGELTDHLLALNHKRVK